MRVVVKPRGFAILAVVVLAGVAVPRLVNRAGSAGLLRDEDWNYTTGDGIKARSEPLKGWGVGRGARRFTAQTAGKYTWSASWTNTLTRTELPTGDTLTLRFRARSRTGSPLIVRLQESQPPFLASLDRTLTPTREWAEYSVTGRSRGYKAGGSQLTFQLAQAAGEIDLADVRLEKIDLTRGGPDE